MSYESLTDKLLKGKKEEKFFVSVVPVSSAGEVLLGRRTEDGIWTTPGGGAEPGEEPHVAARRELFEEAGLVAPENSLELVGINETPRGFKIYCFLWRIPPMFAEAATPKLDPDKEVKSWKLYRPEDFPSAMQSEQNASRLKTIREALMRFYGLTKSTSAERLKAIAAWMFDPECQMETIEDLTEERVESLVAKLNKGGPGSGIRGHKTFHHVHITKHPQYTKEDHDHLKGKGYSEDEIRAIWDRDHKDQKKPVHGKVKAPDAVGHAHGDQKTESQKMRDRRHGIEHKEDTRTEAQRMADTRRGGPGFKRDWGKSEVESLVDKLSKGGPGSGIVGHITPKKEAPARPAVNAAPTDPVTKLQAHLHALEHGGVMPGLKTQSGKPVVNDMDMARAQGYDVQDHVDAMNAHYELAQKTQAMLEKLKTAGHKVPAEGAKIARFHERMMKQHMNARHYLEERKKHTTQALREQQKEHPVNKKDVKKSTTQMGNSVGDRDLDISSFAQASSNGHSAWMERLYTGMEGFQFADEPRSFDCPKGKLTLAKVDDGLYSGFFTTVDGGLEDNAKVRMERMTIPELVQFMTAKEWIANPVMDPPVDTTAEIGQLEHPQPVAPGQPGYTDQFTAALNEKLLAPQPVVAPAPIEQKIKLLELVTKLLS